MLSPSTENYLKHIFYINSQESVSTGDLAELLEVSPASVSKMLKKLKELGLVNYDTHKGVSLSKTGKTAAIQVLRKHRLLELFLVEKLNYKWDEVHEEACELEHYVTEKFTDRLEELLGFPQFDPHGDPIPNKNGDFPKRESVCLTDVEPGSLVKINFISHSDQALLKYLDSLDIRPSSIFRLVSVDPFGGSYQIDISGDLKNIGPKAADKLFVSQVSEEGMVDIA